MRLAGVKIASRDPVRTTSDVLQKVEPVRGQAGKGRTQPPFARMAMMVPEITSRAPTSVARPGTSPKKA
jgi:hypothetical protein